MLKILLDRWPIKVLCLAIAIVLYILFRVNTLTERTLTIPLEVITPEGFVVSSEYARSVNVTLRGEEDDIAGILPEDVEAFVNLSPFPEEGEFSLSVELRKKGTALRPEALELRPRPREITLSQERRTVRSLIVRPELSGFPALGFELTQFFVSPSSVTAVGPRSQMADMEELRAFCRRELHLLPRQVQLFTPTPCTWSTLMYWTGTNPFTGADCFVERNPAGRERQKATLAGTERRPPPAQRRV